MSSEGSQTADNSALAQQVDAVLRESQALTAAVASARRARLYLLLAIVVFVVLVSYVFYDLFRNVTGEKNVDALVEGAQKRLSAQSDIYMQHLTRLSDKVSPVVAEAFNQQLKKDLPGFLQAAENQRDMFAETLENQLPNKLQAQFDKLRTQHQKTIEEEFPQVNDKQQHERMAKNLDKVASKLIKKYYIGQLEDQLNQLFAAWDKFPPAPVPKAGEPPLEDQLVPCMYDMLRYKLARSPSGLTLH
jgi:hypothetical protein